MKLTRFLPVFCFLYFLCLLHNLALAATGNDQPVECKIALRIITSPAYLSRHSGEIPDADQRDDNDKAAFVTHLFQDSIKKTANQEQFCANTIRDNLPDTNTWHLPKPCGDFLPLLKKSFEDKVSYKKDQPNFVRQKMDESIIDMLVMEETDAAGLVQRCEVGIEVMQIDLNDKHLKEKYPLPATCEALFADMEKTLILPSELETMRRQRVIFAVENKNTPKKLEQICDEISK